LRVPDLLVHRVARVVKVSKEAGIDEDVPDPLAVVVKGRGHGHDGNLEGREPEGPILEGEWEVMRGHRRRPKVTRKSYHLPA